MAGAPRFFAVGAGVDALYGASAVVGVIGPCGHTLRTVYPPSAAFGICARGGSRLPLFAVFQNFSVLGLSNFGAVHMVFDDAGVGAVVVAECQPVIRGICTGKLHTVTHTSGALDV